jgi:hypothetical protein
MISKKFFCFSARKKKLESFEKAKVGKEKKKREIQLKKPPEKYLKLLYSI